MNEKLEMTEEQMVEEILFMRDWDNYLQKHMDEKEYDFLLKGFIRERTCKILTNLGASVEEANNICNKVENELSSEKERQ